MDIATKMKIDEKMKHTLAELIELAEFSKDDLTTDQCENASHALETVMKYGTYEDAAKAISHFITYVQLKNNIEFLNV